MTLDADDYNIIPNQEQFDLFLKLKNINDDINKEDICYMYNYLCNILIGCDVENSYYRLLDELRKTKSIESLPTIAKEFSVIKVNSEGIEIVCGKLKEELEFFYNKTSIKKCYFGTHKAFKDRLWVN